MKGTKRYQNSHPHRQHGLLDVLRWQLGLGPKEAASSSAGQEMPYKPQSVVPTIIEKPSPDKVRVTWIGHSTFLIQHQGRNILTDPIFGNCQPSLPLARLRRVAPPGLSFEALPPIHDVLISHCHYDHLDLPTVRRLDSVHAPKFWLPSGLARWFERHSIRRCAELAWWDATRFSEEIQLHCVPAQHFAARSPFDRDRTHWCGWVIKSQAKAVFFAGDTGYCPVFREIGDRFDGFDLAMIPIGVYRPRWLMQPIHINPDEAVRIHMDVRSRLSLACHWGTFALADDPLGEPPTLLAQALASRNLSVSQYRVLRFGESIET